MSDCETRTWHDNNIHYFMIVRVENMGSSGHENYGDEYLSS